MGWVEKNVTQPASKALASIDPGPALGKAAASIDPGPAIGKLALLLIKQLPNQSAEGYQN